MLQLSRRADYGIRGLAALAAQPAGRTLTLEHIASAYGVPETFLRKIFQDLARLGIVRSQRGMGGGFALARRPSRITLREVVEALEGPFQFDLCMLSRTECPYAEGCVVRQSLDEAQRRLIAVLETRTLAQVRGVPCCEARDQGVRSRPARRRRAKS